ncbi:MAG: phage protein [Herbinix sp.]|jgi:uncharacterized phage protein gp47/JayE|nr:phage protein [Herbinix sp.]
MFENRTYENLLAEAMAFITEDVDKQEGSIIRTALAPCIYKLAEAYAQLDNFFDLVSGDTAVGTYLDRVVEDYGISRKGATYATRKIITTGAIEIGKRWSIATTTYRTSELLSENVYSVTCEQLGTIGNMYSGALEALDDVGGINATLTDIIVSGEDEENDDNLRDRFFTKLQSVSTSGNASDYKNWALEVPGTGDAKVFPLWNGNGTVKILVVDENMSIDPELPEFVYNHIETIRPIGAVVTVASPTGKMVDVSALVQLDGSALLPDIIANFTAALSSYLKDAVFETYSISVARIGSILLAIPGVADYTDLFINGSTSNVIIGAEEMPISGTITIEEG